MWSMVVYIHRGMEGGERIGCANDTMSGVMSERADDERHGGEHVGSYDLSKKPPLPTQRSHVAAKRTRSLTHAMKQLAEIKVTQNLRAVIVSGGLPTWRSHVAVKRTRNLTSCNERPRWRWGKTTMSRDCIGMKVRQAAIVTESPLT